MAVRPPRRGELRGEGGLEGAADQDRGEGRRARRPRRARPLLGRRPVLVLRVAVRRHAARDLAGAAVDSRARDRPARRDRDAARDRRLLVQSSTSRRTASRSRLRRRRARFVIVTSDADAVPRGLLGATERRIEFDLGVTADQNGVSLDGGGRLSTTHPAQPLDRPGHGEDDPARARPGRLRRPAPSWRSPPPRASRSSSAR